MKTKNTTNLLLAIDAMMAVICVIGMFLGSEVSSFTLLLWVLIAGMAHLSMHKLTQALGEATKFHNALVRWAVEGYRRKKKVFDLTGDVEAEKQMEGYKMLMEKLGAK